MFDIKDGQLKISVRRLVEFICRSGDIDNRFGGISDKSAMDAGARVHKKIQKSMGPDYRAEVPLKCETVLDNYTVIVEGRADGIFYQNGITTIDEIKGTYKEVRHLPEPIAVHKAQAMCYAYFYALDNGCDKMCVRLTYVNLDTENVKYFEETLSFDELKKWYDQIFEELVKWGNYVYEHKQSRNASIEKLEFPFEYRPGQRELAVSVYRASGLKTNLFIQAPTGVGKTISTVYPSVMAVGAGRADKIFYLTAKTITRGVAEDAFSVLREQNMDFKTVTITAKDKVCMLASESGPECNPFVCPFAKGHFDRVNDAVFDLITHENVISRQIIEAYALKHNVCPFEFCLDVSYWVDGIICDYNYVFDPHVYLKRFFSEGNSDEYIFLIDEAHNLVDRSREMYSASIYKDKILENKRLVKDYSKRLAKEMDRCNSNLLEYKRCCDATYVVLENVDSFAYNMQRLGEEISLFMENNREFPFMRELLEFYFDVMHFNQIYEELTDGYVIYAEHTENGFMLRLFCVDPSQSVRKRTELSVSTVFFSATLLPVNYYKKMFAGNTDDYAVYARSPFDTGKRLLTIGKDVTSRYTRRNSSEYAKIKEYITNIVSAHDGNYLVFFPSYKYMEDVYSTFAEGDAIYDRIVVQKQDMDERKKEEFLELFEGTATVIGFCVMGGVFSEGIDLKEDRLVGAIVVGTGLSAINTSNELLRQYYDSREGCGYEYAYVYPGMNRVLQAAGRVIRTDSDMGVIALLDDRFLTNQYIRLFPREWEDYVATDKNGVKQLVLDFWQK